MTTSPEAKSVRLSTDQLRRGDSQKTGMRQLIIPQTESVTLAATNQRAQRSTFAALDQRASLVPRGSVSLNHHPLGCLKSFQPKSQPQEPAW